MITSNFLIFLNIYFTINISLKSDASWVSIGTTIIIYNIQIEHNFVKFSYALYVVQLF